MELGLSDGLAVDGDCGYQHAVLLQEEEVDLEGIALDRILETM